MQQQKTELLSFAPGPVPGDFSFSITYSHRTDEFVELYREVVKKLKALCPGYEVLLIQGSASSAIEAVVRSLGMTSNNTEMASYGTFGDRFQQALDTNVHEHRHRKFRASVAFETSRSLLCTTPRYGDEVLVQDCVSSFPYWYDDQADVLITSSSKILAGLPVIGIVYIKQYLLDEAEEFYGYLSLKEYEKYGKHGTTPHTSLLPQLMTLNKALDDVISKETILNNCRIMQQAKVRFYGDVNSPVLTMELTHEQVERLKQARIQLYHNKVYTDGNIYQASMFNYKDKQKYERLVEVLNEDSM